MAQQANFLVLGSLMIVFAFAFKRTVEPSRRTTVAAVLIALFGLSAGIGSAVLPCDAGCDGATTIGLLHNTTGVLGFLAALATMFTLAKRFPFRGNRAPYQRYSFILGIVGALGLMAFIALRATGSNIALDGVAQRVFVGAWLLWIEITALRLFKATRAAM